MDEDTNEDGRTFDDWEHEANAACVQLSGLSLHDLADGPSYDAWADCVSPEDYATERLQDEGFPFEDAPVAEPVPVPVPVPVRYGDGSDASVIVRVAIDGFYADIYVPVGEISR